MSRPIDTFQLPTSLSTEEAVDAAYAPELAEIAADLARGLPVLVNCDKEVAPFIYMNLRDRLRSLGLPCVYMDGRQEESGELSGAMAQSMLRGVRQAVRSATGRHVLVLPHLDLLAPSAVSLTADTRELIPLLYENPELIWLGFKDPSFAVPRVVENRFTRVVDLVGIARERLHRLVTQGEAKKFGRDFNPWGLYKYVSGMNAARLRRVLATLDGPDYPATPQAAYQAIRSATTTSMLEIPHVDLEADIGGYPEVKERLRHDVLDILRAKDQTEDLVEIKRLEQLIPRGIILWGPPGTGKTLFAKAMATALGAAVTIVSGPELKSRWVGESEQNLRQVFHAARQSAPSIIVFDELDSFASQRGTYTGSGVEHSMVNQLLTEMDGFHSDELVFVVGTTNLVELLDPALLRPGRFELMIHVPYPRPQDRREILQLWGEHFGLGFDEKTLEFAVRRTQGQPRDPSIHHLAANGAASHPASMPSVSGGYSGDHLHAICRALARERHLAERHEPVSVEDIEHVLMRWRDPPEQLSEDELRVVAAHEAGHALCSHLLDRTVSRISIEEEGWTLARVEHADVSGGSPSGQVWHRPDLCRRLAVLLAGREAERLLFAEISAGAYDDLAQATRLANEMVVTLGMSEESLGMGAFPADRVHSQAQLQRIEQATRELLEQAAEQAAQILKQRRKTLESLSGELLRRKTISGDRLAEMVGEEE